MSEFICPVCGLIRRHLFVFVLRVTKTTFDRLILFETGAGQKRVARAGKARNGLRRDDMI